MKKPILLCGDILDGQLTALASKSLNRIRFIIDNYFNQAYHYRMSITKTDNITRNFFLGFIRLHILHHASIVPIFGLDMIRELETHGYSLSPGTLYPILHGLEKEGFLESQKQVVSGKVRKYYQATESGKAVLAEAMNQVRELIDEIKTI